MLYTAAQVARFDRYWIDDLGMDGFVLMQRAAKTAFQAMQNRWGDNQNKTMAVFCGGGHNGADGYLIAQLAVQAGYQVSVYCLAKAALKGDTLKAQQAFLQTGAAEYNYASHGGIEPAEIVVDALFGTGLNRAVGGDYAKAIADINRLGGAGAKVLAVDVPTGVNASTGGLWGRSVKADLTVSFIGAKQGLYTGAGLAHAGELLCDALQAPPEVYAIGQPSSRLISDATRPHLPARDMNSHKGDFGWVGCVGGNRGFGGAIRMAGEAALRVGAGRASIACHSDYAAFISMMRPELMCQPVAKDACLDSYLSPLSVLALGPGLGQDAWAKHLWAQGLACPQPKVIDADGLNLLAKQPQKLSSQDVITPHPGEAARLLNTDIATIQADRFASAQKLAQNYQAVVVLKGAGTIVADDQQCWVNTTGNPGMASAGMGDVLTGVIAGLMAQGLTSLEAAKLGVWLHGRAADLAANKHGQRVLLATDLMPPLQHWVN